MPDAGLAHLSDTLFTSAIAVYSLALVSYCGEYAFGRRGRVAATAEEREAIPVSAGSHDAVALTASASASLDARTAASPTEVGEVLGGERISRASATQASRAGRADRFGRLALALTALGLVVHVGSLIVRGIAVDRVPWGNMYEFSAVAGAAAVAAFLIVLVRQPRLRYLGMFVILPVILLMFLAGTVLYAKAGPLVPALRSYWLVIHVSAAAISTGIFLVSAVATVLFLIRSRWEAAVAAGHQPTRFPLTLGWRLPGASTLDSMAYRTVAFGFPLYTFAVIAGAIWAEAAWGRYWGWDPKETWAFVVWVVYAAYLHARATAGWRGVKAARVNLLGFSAIIFNFFVVNIVISGLHSYAGLS